MKNQRVPGRGAAGPGVRTSSVGQEAIRSTASAVLPIRKRVRPVCPCAPITMVAAAWRPGRTLLVTDATAARGARPGPIRLGGTDAVWDGTTIRTDDGTRDGRERHGGGGGGDELLAPADPDPVARRRLLL